MRQLPEEERIQLGKLSLMSPAIAQLLEDLEDEDSDSSGEDQDEDVLSGEEDLVGSNKLDSSRPPHQDKNRQRTESAHEPSALSPSRAASKSISGRGAGHLQARTEHSTRVASAHQKPAHMARFHSLRSMLFHANIENKMKTVTSEDCRREEEVAQKWKDQHEQRQMHRPKTPEKEHPAEKEGIASKIKTKLKRMTSKEAPVLQDIGEHDPVAKFDDYASTASSDADEDLLPESGKHEISENGSVNQSDVDDLVRWVSRRDPVSDGEGRKERRDRSHVKEDSGHESLGNSDIEDLVRMVSRRSETRYTPDNHTGYSDASTESDSDFANKSSEEEDADDLVRWISHRDGQKAGPVSRKLERDELDSEVEQHYDSDIPELGRWVKRHDETSGDSAPSSPVHREELQLDDNETERGRSRSRESPSSTQQAKNHLTYDDVDELVRWVSRKDRNQEQSILENEDRVMEWQRQEDEKKKQIGMTVDEGSLSHSDVKELIEHVRSISLQDVPVKTNTTEAEMGSLGAIQAGDDDSQIFKHNDESKKQQLGMTVDEGSLSQSDIQEIVEYVRKNSTATSGLNEMNKQGS